MFSISVLDEKHLPTITSIINNKTKPLGALGQLEELASQLALIQSQDQNDVVQCIEINHPTMIVFAGDHRIASHGISIAPSDVTRQMVLNFLAGGAAVNCFCRTNHIDLKVVDCGILTPLHQAEKANFESLANDIYIEQRLGDGINDISVENAMSAEQVEQGLRYGKNIANNVINKGCNLLLLGEMGIANTSSASAIIAALSEDSVESFVGLGTGINDEQLLLKKQLLSKAVARIDKHKAQISPYYLLEALAGFEIVQMVGAILAAAEQGVPTLVDGFIVSSAALIATKINPNVRDYLIFAHQSNEQAHKAMLNMMNAKALLNLGLRLGEGTGAALALPLLRCAADFYNNMASFESAGVTV